MAADMTVDIRASGTDYVCTLFPRKRDSAGDDLKHRFRLEVNDQILRARIAKETEPLRNLVFALGVFADRSDRCRGGQRRGDWHVTGGHQAGAVSHNAAATCLATAADALPPARPRLGAPHQFGRRARFCDAR